MKAQKETNYFSPEFQYAAVKALIESPDLLGKIYKVLNQNCFQDTWVKTIVGTIKDLYSSIKMTPSYKEIKFKLSQKWTDENEQQYYEETLEKIRNSNEISPTLAEQELKSFFRKKYRLAAVNEFLNDGAFDDKAVKKLQKKLNDASDIGFDGSIESEINEDTVFKALTEGPENFIPTFIPGLDEQINGGLQRGEIGLFMAATGKGKTTFARTLTHNLAVNGYKSLLIYFEDTPEDMIRADIALTTNVKKYKLRNISEKSAAEMTERYFNNYSETAMVSQNKKLCRMENKQTDASDIENKLQEYITRGFRPDVLVIDYFGCLKYSYGYGKKDYEAQADTMKYLTNLGKKYNMAVWVTNQTNSSGLNPECTPSMDQWMNGKEATYGAAIFIQLVKTSEQSQNDRADLWLHKVRGVQNMPVLEDIIYDNGTGRIDCTNANASSKKTKEALDYIESDPPKYSVHSE